MFWDDWTDTDWKIYSFFVATGVLLVWNLALTISMFVMMSSIRKYNQQDDRNNRSWNQTDVPSIPRLKTAFERRTPNGDRLEESRNRLEDYKYY
ncbi:hypothetical protein WA026_010261 [Henosepilachna vigintioctopunctata]|uniref:Uncharacterized protein n=1 Tax=Henosepilachna vigintioctopunctata TaxID=420089 RepID=A0AAW1UGS8_9CUCU